MGLKLRDELFVVVEVELSTTRISSHLCKSPSFNWDTIDETVGKCEGEGRVN